MAQLSYRGPRHPGQRPGRALLEEVALDPQGAPRAVSGWVAVEFDPGFHEVSIRVTARWVVDWGMCLRDVNAIFNCKDKVTHA